MLVAAAVCPHPPLLVPEIASGAAPELDALRAACDEALRGLLAAGPDLLTVVGNGPSTYAYSSRAGGSFRPYGVDVRVGRGEPVLPLSLAIGMWLLERHEMAGSPPSPARAQLHAVAQHAPVDACLAMGTELAGSAARVGLLVMGDGSARRSAAAPGSLDRRSAGYDRAVADGLATGDSDALAALEPELARDLLVAGRAPWQVLAGAARELDDVSPRLLADEAPYGVGYLVASWSIPESTPAPGVER